MAPDEFTQINIKHVYTEDATGINHTRDFTSTDYLSASAIAKSANFDPNQETRESMVRNLDDNKHAMGDQPDCEDQTPNNVNLRTLPSTIPPSDYGSDDEI